MVDRKQHDVVVNLIAVFLIDLSKELFKCEYKIDVKIVVNLAKNSENWRTLAPVIPKVAFKRQRLKATIAKPEVCSIEKTDEPKVWFDVDNIFLPKTSDLPPDVANGMDNKKTITKTIAIDCEMVGVGENGKVI